MKDTKIKLKKKNKYIFFKLIIIFVSLLFQVLIQIINKFFYNYFLQKKLKLNEEIISTKQNDMLENIKLKYNNDSTLNPYLEKIIINSHVYNKKYEQLRKDKNIMKLKNGYGFINKPFSVFIYVLALLMNIYIQYWF